MLILISVSPLLADSIEQRAKDAKTLLNAFQLNEAFQTYTSILDELSEEQLASEFAYWIYREHGFAAYLLDDHATTLSDIMHMKSIISSFGYPEEAMNEYYYALDVAKKAKDLSLELNCINVYPCGFKSWCKESWDNVKMGVEKTRSFFDESLARVTLNNERLEKILAYRRAQEFYYPNLVYSRDEVEPLAKSIHERNMELTTEFWDFMYDNQLLLIGTTAATAGTILGAVGENPYAMAGGFCMFVAESAAIGQLVKEHAPPLWSKYQDLQKDRTKLTQMEIANREASYTKCIVHGNIPELSYKPYDPEKDAPWYNSYCIFDVNSQKIEFELRFERNY